MMIGLGYIMYFTAYLAVAHGLVFNGWKSGRSSIAKGSVHMNAEPNKDKGPAMYTAEWARIRGMEPGYGGIWPGDPNAKKYKVTIRSRKSGEEFTSMVPSDRYIFFHFEESEIDLPMHNKKRMCRMGCCTTCTVKVLEGNVKMDAPLGLLKDFRQQGYALSCCTYPRSDIVCELQDEDEMYIKQWSESFEGGGVEWGGVFMDED
jgi:ferredoxin